MKFEIIRKQTGSCNCFVCGKDNDGGLFASFYETSNNEVVSIVKTKIGHQSWPEHTHGGVICAILDETAGRAIWPIEPNTLAVTAKIEVKYHRPVPLETEFLVVGKVETNATKWFKGVGKIYSKDGNLLAESVATYIKQSKKAISQSEDMDRELDIFVPDESPVTSIEW